MPKIMEIIEKETKGKSYHTYKYSYDSIGLPSIDYDDDPNKNPNAKKYDTVSIDEVVEKNLQVVDMTASILARDNKMPMWVFGLNEKNSIVNTIKGEFNGTKVTV